MWAQLSIFTTVLCDYTDGKVNYYGLMLVDMYPVLYLPVFALLL